MKLINMLSNLQINLLSRTLEIIKKKMCKKYKKYGCEGCPYDSCTIDHTIRMLNVIYLEED